MKVGILTSVNTRHRYFVQAIRDHVQVVAVGYERTGYTPAGVTAGDLSPGEARIVTEHFAERDRQEQVFFGERSAFVTGTPPFSKGGTEACAVRMIEPGTLNSPEPVACLESAGVDTVVVFGTNLIKPPLLNRWSGRMINLHLGLSPYYRGAGTNFYPLLNEEPEYVGATIHLIDAGIDSGSALARGRMAVTEGNIGHAAFADASGEPKRPRLAIRLERCVLVVHEAGSRG